MKKKKVATTTTTNTRVRRAWRKYKAARDELEGLLSDLGDELAKLYEASDEVNKARRNLEQVCREEGEGVGPITVIRRRSVTYNPDYFEKLLAKEPELLEDLIVRQSKVNNKVLEAYIEAGHITDDEAKLGVADTSVTFQVKGVPHEVLLP